MRPQHDGHDGRPSPQSHADGSPFVPRTRSGETSTFVGRIRQERPEGKTGRHRLDASATQRAARALASMPQPLALPSAASPPPSSEVVVPAEAVTLAEAVTRVEAGAAPAEPVPALPAVHTNELPAAHASELPLKTAPAIGGNAPKAGDFPSPWHDLVAPAGAELAVLKSPALSPDVLPAPPQELSLGRRDSV